MSLSGAGIKLFLNLPVQFLGRLFDRVDLISLASNVRPPYVRLFTKSFFDFNEI